VIHFIAMTDRVDLLIAMVIAFTGSFFIVVCCI